MHQLIDYLNALRESDLDLSEADALAELNRVFGGDPIPTVSPAGFLSEYFLECEPDGVIRVKDGRSLEAYINDPRLVERRKGRSSEMVICSASVFEAGLIPPCA